MKNLIITILIILSTLLAFGFMLSFGIIDANKTWAVVEYLGTTRWYWLAYIVPSVVILIYAIKQNKEVIYWLLREIYDFTKQSLMTDGKPDATKIIAFLVTTFAFIPVVWYCAYSIKEPMHLLWLVGIVATFILVLLRIVLPAHLIELKNGKKEGA
jgi:hypothetical protein